MPGGAWSKNNLPKQTKEHRAKLAYIMAKKRLQPKGYTEEQIKQRISAQFGVAIMNG